MPNQLSGPQFAISCRFDARDWGDGVQLYSRDAIATGVTVAEGTATLGVVHDDVLAFLNGRGISQSWADRLNAEFGGTNFTTGIDSDDRVWVENAAVNFEIEARPDNAAWGFDPGGTGLAGGVAPFRHTAPSEWPRGVMVIPTTGASPLMLVTITTTTKAWPMDRGYTQDVPTSMRGRGTVLDDDDQGNDSLEGLDDALFTGHNCWGVDAQGHVYNSVPYYKYVNEDAAKLVWLNSDLMDRLGFDGTEEYDSSSFYQWRITANKQCRGFAIPSRPLMTLNRGNLTDGSKSRLVSNRTYHVAVSTVETLAMTWHLDGPTDQVDQHWVWLKTCVPLLSDGAPYCLYQEWGDSRRAGTASLGDDYGLTYNVEYDGYRGRLQLYADGHNDGTLSWPDVLRRRSPISSFANLRP